MDLAEELHRAGLMSDKQLQELRVEQIAEEIDRLTKIVSKLEAEREADRPNLSPTEARIIKFAQACKTAMGKDVKVWIDLPSPKEIVVRQGLDEVFIIGVLFAEDRSMTKSAIVRSIIPYRIGLYKMMQTPGGLSKLLFS